MKELTIEEKAKAYDKALAIARDFYNSTKYSKSHAEVKATYEAIFPVLKESKDEKIRKALIEGFKVMKDRSYGECTFSNYNIPVTYIIAWLEKQGEPKEINPSEFDLRLNILLKHFEPLPKEEIASVLSFYLNVVQNNGTYKEEKQGEQKPNPCENCSIATNNCQKFPCTIRDGEQKPAEWSEEDERKKNKLIWIFEEIKKGANYFYGSDVKEIIDWLKSLKDRVLPQPWSYYDEIIIGTIIQEVEKIPSEKFIDNAKYRCLDWLRYRTKSLRPQSHWKPSDEQIEALLSTLPVVKGSGDKVQGMLESLYNDLKKLKG